MLTDEEIENALLDDDDFDEEDIDTTPGPSTSASSSLPFTADNRENAFLRILNDADCSDNDSSDEEIFSDHDSSTDIEEERDGGISPTPDPPESSTAQRSNYYFGKNNCMRWAKQPPAQSRTPAHNIISISVGKPKGPATTLGPETSLADVFDLFIDEHILETIVLHTNAKIEQVQLKYKIFKRAHLSRTIWRPTFINLTTITELRAFIGLLYLAGLFKSNHENLSSLWASDGTGRDIFRCTMTLCRFRFLMSCLRFDDANTRRERAKDNKLAAISDIFSQWISHCQNNYSPGATLTVDEMLAPFRGRCAFRMYMPKKPARYGLKIVILTDAKTHYMVNAEVYCGKTSDRPRAKNDKLLPTQVVLRLVPPVEGSNRNITGDNWFSSIELVDELWSRKLTYVGTMKSNKREIPREFLPHKTREVESSLFGFTAKITMTSYVPKKSKAVVLISSMHHDSEIVPDQHNKPAMITFYNETKVGVDALDQKCANFSVARATRRWPMVLFNAMVNITGVNSKVIYDAVSGKSENRPNYLRRLGIELCLPYVRQRIYNEKIPRQLRMITSRVFKLPMPERSVPAVSNVASKRKRCSICPYKKDRKTNSVCSSCKIPICNTCSIIVCPNCSENK